MIVRLMELKDLESVLRIEESIYKTPWDRKAFVSELTENKYSYMFVLVEKELIIGYYGMWIVSDYATVTKVSIMKELQGNNLSKILMDDLIDRCQKAEVSSIDLEVRTSNIPAINLYHSYGFIDTSIRKKYYADGEDAILMLKKLKEDDEYERVHIRN